jgi:hypothetical protein
MHHHGKLIPTCAAIYDALHHSDFSTLVHIRNIVNSLTLWSIITVHNILVAEENNQVLLCVCCKMGMHFLVTVMTGTSTAMNAA